MKIEIQERSRLRFRELATLVGETYVQVIVICARAQADSHGADDWW